MATLPQLPSLLNESVFPLPESNTIEFKQSLKSCSKEKICETICAFINTSGGHLLFGINDSARNIIGVPKDKSLDEFLLMIDHIVHQNAIRSMNGNRLKIDTITSQLLPAKNGKFVLAITINCIEGGQFSIEGNIWHRLSVSNIKLNDGKMYTEQQVNMMIANVKKDNKRDFSVLMDCAKKSESENNKAVKKLASEIDKVSKECEKYKDLLYDAILMQKKKIDAQIEEKKQNWWSKCFYSSIPATDEQIKEFIPKNRTGLKITKPTVPIMETV